MGFAILLWPFVAISVKRLHDLNISGWWLVAAAIIPFASRITYIGPATLWLIAVVLLGFIPGKSGSNRFGNDPLPRTGV
jgi:uncharacterized membrane protein YhaH (DUF805 family)